MGVSLDLVRAWGIMIPMTSYNALNHCDDDQLALIELFHYRGDQTLGLVMQTEGRNNQLFLFDNTTAKLTEAYAHNIKGDAGFDFCIPLSNEDFGECTEDEKKKSKYEQERRAKIKTSKAYQNIILGLEEGLEKTKEDLQDKQALEEDPGRKEWLENNYKAIQDLKGLIEKHLACGFGKWECSHYH